MENILCRATELKPYVSKLVSDFVKSLVQEVSTDIMQRSESEALEIRKELDSLKSKLDQMDLPCVLELFEGKPSFSPGIRGAFLRLQALYETE